MKLKKTVISMVIPFLILVVFFGMFELWHSLPATYASGMHLQRLGSMSFGVTIDYASYRYLGYVCGGFDVINSEKQIELAKNLGMDFVRFDIRNEALNCKEEINKLDMIIRYARLKNLRILIGVYGMETWYDKNFVNFPAGGSGKATWKQFRDMYLKESLFLAKRYKPDFMIIIPECPFNIGNQINSVRTSEEWVEYTKEVAHAIKNISPGTKIVLNEIPRKNKALGLYCYDYVEDVMKDGSNLIDAIGSDSYSYEDIKTDIENLVYLKNKFGWHGSLWVTEANFIADKDVFTKASTRQEDTEQKDFFVYAINLADKNLFSGFCVFNFTDGANKGGRGWGITYNNFIPKPAYFAIKNLLHSRVKIKPGILKIRNK